MPSPSPLSSLAAKLLRQQLLPSSSSSSSSSSFPSSFAAGGRCFASKAGKDKGKAKSGGSEKDPPPPAASAAADKKGSNKKPHWSQQVFYKVSARLIPVLDCKEATRPEAIERLWDYIKSNNLQDNDEIVCDEHLKKAFGQAKVPRGEVLKFLDVNLTRLKPGCHA